MYSFLNTDYLPAGTAALRVPDLSIQRGYGLFDFFKTINHKPIFIDDHLSRFFHSAKRLRLPVGKTREELKAIVAGLQQRNDMADSGIRLTLTGGYSSDGYSLATPNLIITQQPLMIDLKTDCPPPIRLITYAHQRQLPDIKTIDYLMAIWLQPLLVERNANDVLYHHDGVVTECPRSNFFVVTADDTLVTPARNMLKGITRMKILALAREMCSSNRVLRVEERDIHVTELPAAKEAFITSTGRHIVPVSHIDDQPIGTEAEAAAAAAKPIPANPIASELNSRLHQLVYSENS